MNIEARRQYIKAVKVRYKNSSKKQKTQILNELCLNCSYSRKHAIKLLNQPFKPGNVLKFKRSVGAPRKYSKESQRRLIELWQIMNYLCSRNLQQALIHWLPYDLDTSEDIKKELLAMSASTIERLLSETKNKRPKGKSTTRSSSLKTTIPLKLCKDSDKKSIGNFEADTVAHCGESLAGQFAWTLTMTDLYSGWTENRSCFNKAAESIKEAVIDIKNNLPFAFISFSSDNGTEFINETLKGYLMDKDVHMSRGRPYKKNDNAHVEQKNNTHVRSLFGYQRIEGGKFIDLMNEIYSIWNALKNFYVPCLKLKSKERIGGKVKKKYDIPKTPYQRIIESGQLSIIEKERLEKAKSKLNPFLLKKKLDEKLRIFFNLLERSRVDLKLVA